MFNFPQCTFFVNFGIPKVLKKHQIRYIHPTGIKFETFLGHLIFSKCTFSVNFGISEFSKRSQIRCIYTSGINFRVFFRDL